jgi:hypothetical protein
MPGRCLLRAVAAEGVLAASLFAVGSTGTIIGTVTDSSGGVIPQAHVTVRSQATNAIRAVETNGEGDYSVPLLPPGLYRVSAERQGFRRSVYRDVTLDVDQTARVDFTLSIGAAVEDVTVTATPPLVQTDTSTLGQVIGRRQVRDLPLNERNFLSFALLVPGGQAPAEGSMNSTQGGAISVNGAREQSNNFLLDGVDNNDAYINQYVVLPSIDAIQEFKVQSGNYSAEFGRGGGAQVNVVLRSGANQLHGSLFEYFRNRRLDAKNAFDLPGDIPRFDRNQFGGSLGGPIRRDKTFFFGSYEGLRLRQAATRQATVPSQVERAAALAAVPDPYRNPSGLAIFNLYPAANSGPDPATSNIFTSAPVIRNSVNMPLVKVDHQAGPNNSFSAHWSMFDENRFNPFDPVNSFTDLPEYGSYTLNRGQNAGVSWTRLFGSRWVNEAHVGFNRLRSDALQQHHGVNLNQALGFPTVLSNPVDLGYPNVSVLGYAGIGEPANYPQVHHDNTFEFADNLAWNLGRHQFKFGADIRRIQSNTFLDFLSRGEWFFGAQSAGMPVMALAQLLSGVPDYVISAKGDTYAGLRSTGTSFYVQDDIRVLPRLSLNVGLRYEYTSPPIEIHDRFSVPNLSPQSLGCTPAPDCQFIRAGTSGIPRATYRPDRNNFGPRIGLAWRPLKTERFVVRSAYGIFYDTGILTINFFPRANPPFYQLILSPNDPSNPLPLQFILSRPGIPLVQPNAVSPNFRDAYMQQWNLDLQYEVRPNWMIDLAYVGSKGTRLPSPRDLNQPRPDTGAVAYPQFSSVLYVESGASSTYNALQFRSEKRLSRGLTFLAAYTWSKSIDDASAVFSAHTVSGLPQDSQNLRAERGLSSFHTAHRFVFSYLYNLPFGVGHRWGGGSAFTKALLSDWTLAGILTLQTGHPFTVNRGTTQSGVASSAFGVPDRPDLIADPLRAGPVVNNPDPACQATVSQGGRAADRVHTVATWFNPCAFAAPPPGRFGAAGRNILIGPGTNNLDFSLARSIPLRSERHRLEVRGDLFNLFNHPNYDIPGRIFESQTFARILTENEYGNKPPRQIQLSLRYVF